METHPRILRPANTVVLVVELSIGRTSSLITLVGSNKPTIKAGISNTVVSIVKTVPSDVMVLLSVALNDLKIGNPFDLSSS